MICNSPVSIIFLTESDDASLSALFSYLRSMPHVRLSVKTQLPQDLSPYDVVVTFNDQNSDHTRDALTQFVRSGGGWLTLVLSEHSLPSILGAQLEPLEPPAELRVLFETPGHPLAVRLPDAIYLNGCQRALTRTADDTETILYADWHYSHKAVLTYRGEGKGRVACTTLQAYSEPKLQRILYRLLYQLSGQEMNSGSLGVGILGYAPSVGRIHGLGAEKTPGFALHAVCDLNPERLQQARNDFPNVKIHDSAEKISSDPDVDLVIVATPPNTHARLCLQIMDNGKHVVCEKPLTLNRREADTLVDMAAKQKVHLSCHQNRRWDPDYLAIKQSLAEGLIGDVFYLETFVGGFHHPCGYWHSHAQVSGGTSYDWGAHYIDWIVSLIPDRVEAVGGTRHKRVWHDVTNADQERI